ncbi:MAG: hypothetical protein C4298_02695 [Thermus sp.]
MPPGMRDQSLQGKTAWIAVSRAREALRPPLSPMPLEGSRFEPAGLPGPGSRRKPLPSKEGLEAALC